MPGRLEREVGPLGDFQASVDGADGKEVALAELGEGGADGGGAVGRREEDDAASAACPAGFAAPGSSAIARRRRRARSRESRRRGRAPGERPTLRRERGPWPGSPWFGRPRPSPRRRGARLRGGRPRGRRLRGGPGRSPSCSCRTNAKLPCRGASGGAPRGRHPRPRARRACGRARTRSGAGRPRAAESSPGLRRACRRTRVSTSRTKSTRSTPARPRGENRSSAPISATRRAEEPPSPEPNGTSELISISRGSLICRARISDPTSAVSGAARSSSAVPERSSEPRSLSETRNPFLPRRNAAASETVDGKVDGDRAGMENVQRPEIEGAAGQIDPGRCGRLDELSHGPNSNLESLLVPGAGGAEEARLLEGHAFDSHRLADRGLREAARANRAAARPPRPACRRPAHAAAPAPGRRRAPPRGATRSAGKRGSRSSFGTRAWPGRRGPPSRCRSAHRCSGAPLRNAVRHDRNDQEHHGRGQPQEGCAGRGREMGAVIDPQAEPVGGLGSREPRSERPGEPLGRQGSVGAGTAARKVGVEGLFLRPGHFPVEVRVNQEAGFYAVHLGHDQ